MRTTLSNKRLAAACFASVVLMTSGAFAVDVTIESRYGKDSVSPPANADGSPLSVNAETVQLFEAPVDIYLDDEFQELEGTADNILNHAFYRAVPVGYSVDGQDVVQLNTDRSASLTIRNNIRFTWIWELQNALFVESGVGSAGAEPAIGKHWYGENSEPVSVQVNGFVNSDTTRTRLKGYQIDNASLGLVPGTDATDKFTMLGTTADELSRPFPRWIQNTDPIFGTPTFGGNWTTSVPSFEPKLVSTFDPARSSTVEFWYRLDRYPDGNETLRLFDLTVGSKGTGCLLDCGFRTFRLFMTMDGSGNLSVFSEQQDIDRNGTTVVSTRRSRLANVPGELIGLDEWHHWAMVISGPRTNKVLTIFRDGVAIEAESVDIDFGGGFLGVFEGEPSELYRLSFREGSFNNFRIWNQNIGKQGLINSSTQSQQNAAQYQKLFQEGNMDFLIEAFGLKEFIFEETPQVFDTLQLVMDDWRKITWLWEGEVRYRMDARSGTPGSEAQFYGQSFARIFNVDGTPGDYDFANSPNYDVWVPLGRKVEVGAFYRTTDNCNTLGDFSSPPGGDMATAGTDISNLEDQMVNNRVARVFTVEVENGTDPTGAQSPTEVHWNYQPTVFRAVVPLGQSFDAVNPNAQLVPDLCVGGALRKGTTGPERGFEQVGPASVDGRVTGDPLRWDQLGKKLYPVHPGSYRINWRDESVLDREYTIEIVTGYPGETVPLSSEREDEDGSRQGSAPDWVRSVELADVSDAFPAAPGAHYRHLIDANINRRPPTKLNLDPTDEWFFEQLTYTDPGTDGVAVVSQPGVPFTAEAEGRSVLLFRVRPNRDEIADGTPEKEELAVRIVESRPIVRAFPESPVNVLGRRGFQLGHGTGSDRAVGFEGEGEGQVPDIDPGRDFVLDFWLDAKEMGGEEVKVLSTGDGAFEVTLDGSERTITASYFGMQTIHEVPRGGARWRHYIVHVFENLDLGLETAVIEFFADGDLRRDGRPTAALTPGRPTNIGALMLGANARPADAIRIDQLRFYKLLTTPAELTNGEQQRLRSMRSTDLRGFDPLIWFDFENSLLESSGNFKIGPVAISEDAVRIRVSPQEVATRLESTLDNAGFDGSGYILNEISNYNASLYLRANEVGQWGPIFPVNHGQLYTEDARRLEVAYYENLYRINRSANPNVAWPYQVAAYDEVIYPFHGPHRDKEAVIASRIGTEGVDRNGRQQQVYDLEAYADLAIYNQPNRSLPGFNPNEEHAIVAASNRAGLKVKTLGEDIPNNPPLAAFPLQKDINVTAPDGYTSEPWVLVQINNLISGEPEMAAYRVYAERTELDGRLIAFPRPADGNVGGNTGLAYESAANPDDRFLTMDPNGSFPFLYKFNYPAFAGDLLIPPYPLNLVIGNTTMVDARGRNVRTTRDQRTLWRDVNENAWIVSGDGRFFYRYFYPHRSDFYLPGRAVGTPVAWLPEDGNTFTGSGTSLNPVRVFYDTFWRSDYPKLKRGETLTYQGGEYFNETPGAQGLPALVAMAAAEVVYDSKTPSMRLTSVADLNNYGARIIRPLDRREQAFTTDEMDAAGFAPAATEKIFIVAERWYFKELPGSLQKRFYFDSLAEKLVFRGILNDKESGDADLTSGPDPINILEPNSLTLDEYRLMRALSADAAWTAAVDAIFLLTQNPHSIDGVTPVVTSQSFYSGVRDVPNNYPNDLTQFWDPFGLLALVLPAVRYAHLDSFGVGGALVQNPSLLTASTGETVFITIAENNRTELDGAPVSLHIIEVIPDRFRGAIKVIEAADAFSEKVTLQHSGDFGANTGDLYYEWWIRDAAPLDVVADEVLADGTLTEFDSQGQSLWQEYLPKDRVEDGTLTEAQKHLGLHSIVFEGSPTVVLADKLVLLRYRHMSEGPGWNLIPFEVADSAAAWNPLNAQGKAPFQWAGAANSPQLQADGSKRYIPQLIMGWVKRVLDRINPYEARYTDFFSNESPATYSSQIQIAGAPFAGKVALNSDKNVIENTGLIELYETVLQRARELSIDNSTNAVSTDAINQALLLAATRLTVLYELLAREAYSDAQDATITVSEDDIGNLQAVSAFTHPFQGLESSLLHEELSLLRGTDFRKSFPVFNRMFWNYTKGLGEAAYNVNYNIYDANTDGFINEDDARALYPQGHGDAWGHFTSALSMHYELLQQPVFKWNARSELYALMQNVLEVDYLDEKTFAKLAAGRARTGRDIVRATYRLHYTEDPDGQWQGYTDSADPARAWGVSEWSQRAGQGALFDWAVANALFPEDADNATPVNDPENLDRIDRLGAQDEVGEISLALVDIQLAADESNGGVNPLGFDADAIAFDLDPAYLEVGSGIQGETHFEQIYDRALIAGNNAIATLNNATQVENKLRSVADDTDALIVEALRQDIDYRNRLIEIFGRPYDGTIGFGKVYPEGYEGPDTLLYAYLDRTTIERIIPETADSPPTNLVHFDVPYQEALGVQMGNQELIDLYNNIHGSDDDEGPAKLALAFRTLIGTGPYEQFEGTNGLDLPVRRAADYAFEAEQPAWGQRTSYGSVQRVLEEMLVAEIEYKADLTDYFGYLQDWEAKVQRLISELELLKKRESLEGNIQFIRIYESVIIQALNIAGGVAEAAAELVEDVKDTGADAAPKAVGFSNDVGAPVRAAVKAIGSTAEGVLRGTKVATDGLVALAESVRDEQVFALERDLGRTDRISEIEGLIEELVNLSGGDGPKRQNLGVKLQALELKRQEYFTALAEGFRLLREREAFNKILAASVQKNRYQDMLFRISRNEAMSKYQSAFNHAARYAWLAAKAYDYETSLDPGHPAAASSILDQIVKERQLGLWTDGEPQVGKGGLAEILATLNANFNVLESQLGINSFQIANEDISLRRELFRIGQGSASDARWTNALKARMVDDLWQVPEFRQHCRPFADPTDGVQPGLLLRFRTSIEPGLNFFGRPIGKDDHVYSTANYATKIGAVGVFLEDYASAELAITPRAYLIPIGTDYLRVSNADRPVTRSWNVRDTRIPTPYTINQNQLTAPGFIPSLDGVDGRFGEIRRHGDFRMYHEDELDLADDEQSTRLTGRSIWNSEWLLIIPGAGLFADPEMGLTKFTEHVSDIKLNFKTYSHNGQ